MPKPEPDLPDSVVLGTFSGLKNTVAPERLSATDLERALNVDIDDAGQIRRRRGRSLMISGSWHSVKGPLAGKVYGVRNGALGIIQRGPVFTPLYIYVGTSRVCYTEVNEEVYFSSDSMSGVVSQAGTVASWGATDGQGFWDSPVYSPTDTLGEVGGTLLGDPPKATQIEAYKGRIYLAVGKDLWATELYRYHFVDRTRGFIQFEHDITLVMGMDDGLYVGTTGGLYFLQGTFESFKLSQVATAAVLPGSGVTVPANLVLPQARNQDVPTGVAVMMMTSDGIMACFDGGQTYNLTQGRVEFPEGISAAGLYRQDLGANHFVATLDSRGTPSANARLGDHVDAELIRAIDRPAPVVGPIWLLAIGTWDDNGIWDDTAIWGGG